MQVVRTVDPIPLEADQLHEKVLKTYEAIGYPRAIVGSWAISENDIKDFVSFAVAAKPTKILEIGTYVGVSTMLLALACPNAQIFSVDPDLPLEIEMSSARSDINGVNHQATTHAVARRAAAVLGVAERIEFVRGGFAVGDTFSSFLQKEGSRVKIIGPRLCRESGPFDLVFVDGLHSAEAVEADLELAASALTPHGVMILHDCIGYWGANVRSGVFQFLRKNPRFEFTHPRYSDIYRSVGVLRPRQSVGAIGYPTRKPFRKGDLSSGLLATVARLNATLVGDRPVVEIGFGQPTLEDAISGSRTAYASVMLTEPPRRETKASVDRQIANVVEHVEQLRTAAVFSADLLDFASTELIEALVLEISARAAPLILAVTPPGETDVTGPFSRPIAALVDLAERAGQAVYQLPALDIEPERYALLPQARDLGGTSLFTFFVVLAPPGGYIDAMGRSLVRLAAESAAEQEQLELQRVHLAAGYRRYYSDRNHLLTSNSQATDQIKRMQDDLARSASSADVLKLAGRLADMAESVTQFELQRIALQERLAGLEAARKDLEAQLGSERAKIAAAEVAAETAAAKAAAQETALAAFRAEVASLSKSFIETQDELRRSRETLAAAVERERKRASDLSLIALDAFETIEFVDSILRNQEHLIQADHDDSGRTAFATLGDENEIGTKQTFAELVVFRDRVTRVGSHIERMQDDIAMLSARCAAADDALREVRASTSWRVTGPLRYAAHVASLARRFPGWLRRRVSVNLRGRKLVALQAVLNEELAHVGLSAPVFDSQGYEIRYGDVVAAQALRHYLMRGEKEGRRPHQKFDPVFYTQLYPDVAASGASPLLHFLNFGLREGRSPCADLHPLGERAREAGVSSLEYMARN